MSSPATVGLSPTRKCICEICNCGRHRCPHLITRPYEMNEKPCLLSEYTEKYPLYPNTQPRESCKPTAEYKKQDVPMEGISTARRDYVPHQVFPIKQRPPDQYVRRDENMDLLSTYRKDYNPYSISRVAPCLPREQNYFSDEKMTTIPTYKGDYVAWNQPKRDMIKPDNTFRPSEDTFDHKTTTQDDYLYKGPVATKSCKPSYTPHICKVPLEDMTNYKLNYVIHPLTKRYVHEHEPYKPNDVPFEGLTTHKLSYKGLQGDPAKSLKPSYKRPDLDTFAGTTEFRENYLAWPTPAPFTRKREVYTPPKDKMDLRTSAQIHYGNPHGRPATSCKPMGRVVQCTDPFDHRSTMKDDYKAWQYSKPEAIVPHQELKLPAVPMDTLTTFKTHYVPHPLPFTKSFRPRLQARAHLPFAGETTYATSYTPKEIHICPASFKEPPGYVFEKIDEAGHKRFRPASVAQSRCASNSKLADRRGSRTNGRLSQTGIQGIALKA
ncbi:stabilizer of axonemal microtubules 1 [Hemicordylus capensis]|uniref:stabilizer of axonemal microtubules 1 n=1 Tax=Hemicordylus capensis TaxID=884348 RepID=UPI0023025829|nr:stabilizer of axonemal microtubules 1 [Hemicordylus capensis]